MKLLDVNLWLAASWVRHLRHRPIKEWMTGEDGPLAFCRITQMALLRLVTNRAITARDTLTRHQAWTLVETLMRDPRVRLLEEPHGLEPLWKAFSRREDRSHLRWTDDYLAAFAQAADAEFVTLDRGLRTRYPSVRVTCLS